jgi:two-component system sensor histidine kinase DesK
MRLLPKRQNHGWAPYTWLAYFGFFYIQPIVDHVGWKQWLVVGLGTLAFLVLYFGFFWLEDRWQRVDLGLMVLLGIGFGLYNGESACFFIYAAAFMPYAFEKETYALLGMASISAIAVFQWWWLHQPLWALIYSAMLPLVVGGGNIFFAGRERMYDKLRLANDQIEHLAKVAERERIARDLHDVLGHTLSVIILKSELAGKLIDRDPVRAKAEIQDVEQTSRDALAEVRHTIRGYRAMSLQSELKQAASTLKLAGVAVHEETSLVALTPAQEGVLSMLLREAVTNVVRHAAARNCKVRLANVNGSCLLEIHDDGRGGLRVEGNGLRGMRERIEALGGTLQQESNQGTRLLFQFPLTVRGENADYESVKGRSKDNPSCSR